MGMFWANLAWPWLTLRHGQIPVRRKGVHKATHDCTRDGDMSVC